MKRLMVEYAPGTEPREPWNLRERCIVALCIGYLMFTISVWLEVFPPSAWVAALLLFTPLLIVALLESSK